MHREGDRFESDILHKFYNKKIPKHKHMFGYFFIVKTMFYTYILFSTSLNKYYIGSCQNIEQRLQDHLNSRSKFTKIAKDWELKYFETFLTRSEACKRELQIKK